jgi:hypothetical protein
MEEMKWCSSDMLIVLASNKLLVLAWLWLKSAKLGTGNNQKPASQSIHTHCHIIHWTHMEDILYLVCWLQTSYWFWLGSG